MKKQFLVIICISIMFLVGCDLSNTPTSRVEELLSKYQMLDNDIVISYTDLTNDTTVGDEIKDRYEDLIRKQYRNLSYEVKNEEIDGDMAVVSVQVEVMNYYKVIDRYDDGIYSLEDYHKFVLEDLEKVKDMVTYTIEFEIRLDQDDDWQVEPLSELERKKLLGMNS